MNKRKRFPDFADHSKHIGEIIPDVLTGGTKTKKGTRGASSFAGGRQREWREESPDTLARFLILRDLDKTAKGDLILNPDSCADWIPGMNKDLTETGTAAEGWAIAFQESIVGTEVGAGAMPKNVLADYFRELKAFQLAFWYKHAAQIRAVISREWLEEAEADAAAEGWEELAVPDCGTRFFTRTVNRE